jgi:hypothetical protein
MWTLWGPSNRCEFLGVYSVVVEDSITLGYDVWSLAKLLPTIRRNVMCLFLKAYSSEKGTNFTPPRTYYLLKLHRIPEYGMFFLHPPFTFLSLRSKCSPEHPLPLTRTYKVIQTTHLLHFKFVRLCLLFWLAVSWNQEKLFSPISCWLDKTHNSRVREVAAAARREPLTAEEKRT